MAGERAFPPTGLSKIFFDKLTTALLRGRSFDANAEAYLRRSRSVQEPFCQSLVVQVDGDVLVLHVFGGVPLAAGVNIGNLLAVGSCNAELNHGRAHREGSLGDRAEHDAFGDRALNDSAGVEARSDDVIFAGAADLQVFIGGNDRLGGVLVGAVDGDGVFLGQQGVAVDQGQLGSDLRRVPAFR